MSKIGVLLNELDMENIVIVNEVIRALNAWEWMNKYFNGMYQIIHLTNFHGEIYVAHNIFTEIRIVTGYKFIQDIIEVLTEYCYDGEENIQYMNNFWEPRLTEILEIQNNL